MNCKAIVASIILLNILGCSNQTCNTLSPDQTNAEIAPELVSFKNTTDASGKPVELYLHVFNPPGHETDHKCPAIVFFFGGGWKSGTAEHFYPQSKYLASRGMVAICAEYRIRSKHNTTPIECVKDGKSAIRWVRANARKMGINPNRIAAGGGSAGGHVAAATALVKDFDQPGEDTSISPRPNALALFNPVFDNGPDGYGYNRVKDYWQKISPMHNITNDAPPTIVFLGTRDELIPVSTAQKYKKEMEDAGQRCDLHLYQDQPHGFFNKARYYETLLETDKFLISLGYLKGSPTLQK